MRVTNAVARKKRTKKILKHTKGFYGQRSRCKRTAIAARKKSLQHAYIGRKLKKRDMKKLAIMRFSAYAKSQNSSYSRMIGQIKKIGFNIYNFVNLLDYCFINDLNVPSLDKIIKKGV